MRVDTWAYESRAEKRKRELAEFRKIASKVNPFVQAGDNVSLSQARHAVAEANPKPSPYMERVSKRLQERLGGMTDRGQAFEGRALSSRSEKTVEPFSKRGLLERKSPNASPDSFLGSLAHAGNVLVSGRAAQKELGISTGYMDRLAEKGPLGRVAATGIDVATAPATIVTAGVGGVGAAGAKAAGLPLAQRVGARVAQRFAQETAAGTVGTIAGQEASEETYERTGNKYLAGGVGIATGVLTGGAAYNPKATVRTAGKAIDRSSKVEDRLAARLSELQANRRGPRDVTPVDPDELAFGARETAESAGLREIPRNFTSELGGGVLPSRKPKAPSLVEPGGVSELLELPDVTPGLTKRDSLMNTMKRTLGVGVEEDPISTPVMRSRERLKPVVEAQGSRLGAMSASLMEDAFKRDKTGRILDIPGNPTVQDLAAHLPQYEPLMTPAQRAAMTRLRNEIAPYNMLLEKAGVTVGSRPDVEQGGFYLPRGRADLEGADVPIKVGSGRGGAGGRRGFEKHAKFDSMAEGIEAGYEYAPFEEAMRSYGVDAGRRAVDNHVAGYFKAQLDDAGMPLGETPAMRVDPALRAELEDVRNIVSRLEGRLDTAKNRKGVAEGKADELASALNDLTAGNPANASGALRRVRNRIVELRQRGGKYEDEGRILGDMLDDADARLADLTPRWHVAIENARATPRDQGSIGFAQLSGTTFPDSVANAANKYLLAEGPARGFGSAVIKIVDPVNSLLRGLRATADVSFMGIQGLLGLSHNPAGYAQALGIAWKSVANPEALGAYLVQFDDAARAAGRPTSRDWLAAGLQLGGGNTEFAVKGILPGVKANLSKAPLIEQSNRAFGYFGDTLRLEMADAAFVASKGDLQGAARAANLMTGWSPNRFGGDAGQLAQFAPRFFQSQLELMSAALRDRTITGEQARRAFLKMSGGAVLLTVATNEVLGEKTEWNPDKPNFLRIRAGGQDISLLGPWDSMLKGVIKTAQGDPTYFARSKASPVLGTMWDLITGKTFVGENASLTNPEYLIRQLLPFSLADIGRKGVLGTALGVTGLKASPLTPTERLDQIAQERYGVNFRELTPTGEEEIKQAFPELWKQKVDKGSDEMQRYQAANAQKRTDQLADDDLLLSGQLTPRKWADNRKTRRDEMAGRASEIWRNSKKQKGEEPWEIYGQKIEESKVNGIPNLDAVHEWLDAQSQEFQTKVETETGVTATPVEKLRKKLSNEYYDLPAYRGYTGDEARAIDELWTLARNNSRSADDAYMLRALRQVSQGQDPKVIAGTRRRILGLLTTDPRRERWRKANPAGYALIAGQAPLNKAQQDAVRELLK